jgi:beta-galactosidase
MGPRDVLARALLLGGHSFGSVDLSGAPMSYAADLDPDGPAVALASPPVLGRATQQRLVAFVEAGGRLLLHGVLPTLDDDGTDCTVLADALGLAAGERVEGTPHHFPSVRATGWAGDVPEVRVGVLQRLTTTGATQVEPLALDVADGSTVIAEATLAGGGRAVVVACDYPCHLDFWQAVLARLGVRRRVEITGATPGLVTTTTADADGQRLLHLVNVAPVGQRFRVTLDGAPVAGGAELEIPARAGRMLPLDVRLDGGVLRWATAELDGPGDGSTVVLRRGPGAGHALVETDGVVDAEGGEAERTDAGWLVSWPAGADGQQVRVRLGR